MAQELVGDGVGGARVKRRRVDGHAEKWKELDAAGAAKEEEVASAMTCNIASCILPHRDAVRTLALAQGWLRLWESRWAHPTSCRDVRILPGDNPAKVLRLLDLDGGPPHRLDRFSLVVDNSRFRIPHFSRLLKDAAKHHIGDLHVELRRDDMFSSPFVFHLPLSSPLLVHLSLRGVTIGNMYYRDAKPFHGLEVICLHSIGGNPFMWSALIKMLSLCPRLHTLDLRNFFFPTWFDAKPFIMPVLENSRSITLAECRKFTFLYTKEAPRGVREMPIMGYFRYTTGSHDAQSCHHVKDAALLAQLPGLRSFRYSGNYAKSPFNLKEAALLTHLYICLLESVPDSSQFNGSLPMDLSSLTVLTICSNTLKITSSLFKGRGNAGQANLRNLHSLRELQLVMFGMKTDNLADIALFLKCCQCANLERLFVQLPDISGAPLKCLLKCLLEEIKEVDVDPLENGLGNLRIAKFMNSNWSCFEVQLVCFLLRKVCSLTKLLLVSPNITPHLVTCVPKADRLLLNEALANGLIILSKCDDSATQPFHSEVFIKV
ncbi:hypothetical protein ACP4OV_013918 [Aristida adscensionis]